MESFSKWDCFFLSHTLFCFCKNGIPLDKTGDAVLLAKGSDKIKIQSLESFVQVEQVILYFDFVFVIHKGMP